VAAPAGAEWRIKNEEWREAAGKAYLSAFRRTLSPFPIPNSPFRAAARL
jgi:hypothetical protein